MHATLLVHEATFSCDLARDAAAKRHSTIGQALQAAQAMAAWRVVLTHFSQRYSRFAPDLQQLPFAAAARACAAFDGARVRFTDLWLLPVVSRGMEMLVTEEAEESAEKAAQEAADGPTPETAAPL
jgi:ribonuclease Z